MKSTFLFLFTRCESVSPHKRIYSFEFEFLKEEMIILEMRVREMKATKNKKSYLQKRNKCKKKKK